MSELLQVSPQAPPPPKALNPAELTPPLNITLVTEESQLELVQNYFARVPLFAIDIETNVTDDFTERRVRTIQVGDRNEQFVIDLLPFAERAGQALEATQGPDLSSVPYSPIGLPHTCLQPIVSLLTPVLDSDRWLKVGHALQFEYEALKYCLGIHIWNLYDTMLAEKLRYAGLHSPFQQGFWALGDLCERYCHFRMSKEEQKSFDLSSPLSERQIQYCAIDLRVPSGIKVTQQRHLEQANLMQAAKLEFDAIPAFGDMYLNGITLDREKWLTLVASIKLQHEANTAELDKHFIPVVGSKTDGGKLELELEQQKALYESLPKKTPESKAAFTAFRDKTKQLKAFDKLKEKCPGEALLNYGSPLQMLKILQQMGFKISDTNEKTTLKRLSKQPVISALLAYRETEKALSTYGVDFLEHIHPRTGRIHSRIFQIGAATGRTSSRDPNLQNIKRSSQYRKCFIAALRCKLLTLDYNGAELRIATEYSREPAWVEAFKHNWDVHSVGAEIVYGQEWRAAAEPNCKYYLAHEKCDCKKHQSLRTQVKAINFGIAYGIGPEKLAIELGITEADAKELLRIYKAAFPVLMACLDSMGKDAAKSLCARSLSHRARYFTAPSLQQAIESAQRRFGPKPTQMRIKSAFRGLYAAIEREGRNMAVQGTNADMTKLAMGCGSDSNNKKFLWHACRLFGVRMVLMVHDELVFEVPVERAEEFKAVAEDGMVRGGEAFIKCIPTTVEGNLADEWSK